jgi:glycosyltransferase involved in cell wall biosynthesis
VFQGVRAYRELSGLGAGIRPIRKASLAFEGRSCGTRFFLRILHLTDNYPPAYGGFERSVETVSRAQVERGHAVGVVTAARTDLPRVTVEQGVVVHRVPFTLQHLPGAFLDGERRVFFPTAVDPLFAHTFSRILRSFRADVIHTHGWIYFSAAHVADRSGAAIVATAHDYGAVCARKTLFRDGVVCEGPGLVKCLSCAYQHYGPRGIGVAGGLRYSSRMNRFVDLWTGLSAAVTGAGSAPRIRDRQPMEIVPSYVPDSVMDIEKYRQRPPFVPKTDRYIFFAGAVNRSKGVEVLLRAYDKIADTLGVQLVLAGMPEPDLFAALDRDGVTVCPSVPHAEVMAAWVNATVGVIPSIWAEPFGQVAVECLASGTPTVVSRIGGLEHIVEDNISGLLVPPGDATALAAAIQRIVADETLATRLSIGGRIRAREFTVSAILPRIELAYDEAIKIRKAKAAR